VPKGLNRLVIVTGGNKYQNTLLCKKGLYFQIGFGLDESLAQNVFFLFVT
jgi:hypothetical protein